ncbi:urease accessory protein [Hymenobacter lucidus]|uniref:Urease accessory protein n=1 Tax=Hymenobacter lucidus TaxID=2880930 RepID=A0ABS8AM56_9BACT|nr:urease accessory protein [Hymenobacter lucidus]MCB2407292.1 urease accessory protein [Hymenobacter lucidus]
MEALVPIMFASVAGMGHAFEPDHLLAVGNMVSRRDSTVLALRDGIYWGLGHTTMLVLVGSVIILSRATFLTSGYFEAAVGVLLVTMGLSRLLNWNKPVEVRPTRYQHRLAYTVGLLHGLAGSGALVLLVMSEIRRPLPGILYILVFGVGSILGMFVVAGLCSIPFTRRMKINKTLKFSSIFLSSALCIGYGVWMVVQNVG